MWFIRGVGLYTYIVPVCPTHLPNQLTCGAVGLPLACSPSPSCLWVCCSDGGPGEVSILDTLNLNATSPSSCVLASVTLTDSRITSMAVVSHLSPLTPVVSDDVISNDMGNDVITDDSINSDTVRVDSSFPPTISVDSFSSSSISSSSSGTHTDISCSDNLSNLKDSVSNLENSLSNLNVPYYDPNNGQNSSFEPPSVTTPTSGHPQLSPSGFKRVRSNSAPLFINHLSCESSPLDDMVYSPELVDIDSKVFSPLTLRPANLTAEELGGEGHGHCMWLGTADGKVYVCGPGSSLRSHTYEQTVDLSVPITCLR